MSNIFSIFLLENLLKILIPEIFLTNFVLILLLWSTVLGRLYRYDNWNLVRVVVNLSSLILMFYLVLLWNSSDLIAKNDYIIITQLNIFLRILFIFVVLVVFNAFSNSMLLGRIKNYDIIIVMLLSVIGLNILLISNDIILIYLTLELQALSFYILASSQWNKIKSMTAGVKYFYVGSFASGLLLFGLSFLYGLTGLVQLDEIFSFLILSEFYDTSSSNALLLVSLLLILSTILFKIAAVPYHLWAFDVYEGSSIEIVFFFALVPKFILFGFLLNFWNFFIYEFDSIFQKIIVLNSIFSIIYGTLGAFYQKNFKRFYAYSSLVHVGFILLAFLLNSVFGIYTLVLYLLIYIVTAVGVFSVVLSIRNRITNSEFMNISILISLFKKNSSLSLSFSVLLFSLAGIPPLAGFYPKLNIIFYLLSLEYFSLAILIIILAVVSSYYYIRVIKLMFFSKQDNWLILFPCTKKLSYIISLSCFFNLFYLVFNEEIQIFIYSSILS